MNGNDIAAAKRRRLQANLVKAAFDLLEFTQAEGLKATIDGTTPPLLIVIGDAQAIRELLRGE